MASARHRPARPWFTPRIVCLPPFDAVTPSPQPAPRPSVLIVEDEALIRCVLARILRRAGYTVSEAEDGLAALQAIGDHGQRFDAIITDLMMPRLDGVALIEELRRRDPAQPIIAVSALPDSLAVVVNAWGDTITTLRKPYSTELIIETLQQVLAAR